MHFAIGCAFRQNAMKKCLGGIKTETKHDMGTYIFYFMYFLSKSASNKRKKYIYLNKAYIWNI